MLNYLIKKIFVHEYLGEGGILNQTVEIQFNFTDYTEKQRIVRE